MHIINWARHSLALIVAAAVVVARPAHAQVPVPSVDSVSHVVAPAIDTIHVKASAKKSRNARERDLIVGNRFLAKELARYDKRIVELENKLDSLRIEAAHRWKDAREMEDAAAAAREKRLAMERRLAALEAGGTKEER